MPKGRKSAPSTLPDGAWFRHRGVPDTPLERENSTSTEIMLSSTQRPEFTWYPWKPSQKYNEKDSRNFKTSNKFSEHNNRNYLQDHGVYFGNGGDTRELGRRIIPASTRQHHTDKDYLKHHARETIGYEYCPMTATTYRGQPTQHPPRHRRFPKIHKEPTSGCITLPTQTSGWFKDEKLHKTSTQVLADSQEPYLKHNPWKFSYHGVSKCYPRYNEPQKSQHPYPVWVVQGTQDNLKL